MAANQSHPARVLVTRAARGASALADALETLGLEPVLVPAIATVDPSSFAALDRALHNLNSVDWLLFTSATAVEAFAGRARNFDISVLPQHLRIAAIGPATARALELLNRSADLLPPQAVAESLTEALLPYARQPDGAPARFLLPRAEDARDFLPDHLRAAGAEVTIVPAYRTVIPPESIDLVHKIFSDPDHSTAAITFTSASTARNLLALCEAANVSLPATALRISIGPITSETLRDLNIPPHAESPQANVLSLAQTVYEALQAAEGKHQRHP